MKLMKLGKSFILFAAVALVASACGGGGGNESKGSSTVPVEPLSMTNVSITAAEGSTVYNKIRIQAEFEEVGATLYYFVGGLDLASVSFEGSDVIDPTAIGSVYTLYKKDTLSSNNTNAVDSIVDLSSVTGIETIRNVVVVVAGSKGDKVSDVERGTVELNKDPDTFQDGSAKYPFHINNVAQFQEVCSVKSGDVVFGHRAANYILKADLDLEDLENDFVPLCFDSTKTTYQDAAAFIGTFDGNNHVISNLNVNKPEYPYQALFAYAGAGSVIKNLKISNVEINALGFGGSVVGEGSGTIDNVHVKDVEITTSNSGDNGTAGGLAGRINSRANDAPVVIKNSSVTNGKIINQNGNRAGGIVGVVSQASGTTAVNILENNSFIGSVTTLNGDRVGGIGGWIRQAIVRNNFAAGVITGGKITNTTSLQTDFGGIVGYYEGWADTMPLTNEDVGLYDNLTHITHINALPGVAKMGSVLGNYNTTRQGTIENNYGVAPELFGELVGDFVSGSLTVNYENDYVLRDGDEITADKLVDNAFFTENLPSWLEANSNWNIGGTDVVRPFLTNSFDNGKGEIDYNALYASVNATSERIPGPNPEDDPTLDIKITANANGEAESTDLYVLIAKKALSIDSVDVVDYINDEEGATILATDVIDAFKEEEVNTVTEEYTNEDGFDFATTYYAYAVAVENETVSRLAQNSFTTNQKSADPACANSGDGITSPIFVCSAIDFSNINNDLNKKYELKKDIDFGHTEAITTNLIPAAFKGELNGNGFTISGIKISTTAANNGIFKVLEGGAVVKNLVIDNVEVTSTQRYTGTLAGDVKQALVENILLTNSHVEFANEGETLQATMGGLIGRVSNSNFGGAIIRNIQVGTPQDLVDDSKAVTVTFDKVYKLDSTGKGTNHGREIGGVIGAVDYTSPRNAIPETDPIEYYDIKHDISNIVSYANVSSTSEYVGGIVGLGVGDFNNLVAYGAVRGSSSVGGIFGRLMNNNTQNSQGEITDTESRRFPDPRITNVLALNSSIEGLADDKNVQAIVGSFQPRTANTKIYINNYAYYIDDANMKINCKDPANIKSLQAGSTPSVEEGTGDLYYTGTTNSAGLTANKLVFGGAEQPATLAAAVAEVINSWTGMTRLVPATDLTNTGPWAFIKVAIGDEEPEFVDTHYLVLSMFGDLANPVPEVEPEVSGPDA